MAAACCKIHSTGKTGCSSCITRTKTNNKQPRCACDAPGRPLTAEDRTYIGHRQMVLNDRERTASQRTGHAAPSFKGFWRCCRAVARKSPPRNRRRSAHIYDTRHIDLR